MERKIIATTSRGKNVECNIRKIEENILEYCFLWEASKNTETLILEWYEPVSGAIGCWYPDCGYERTFGADWQKQRKTMLSISAPVYCLYDQKGENCFTVALSETVREVEWKTGVHEEDGTFLFHCEIYLGRGKDSVKLYINEKKEMYESILDGVLGWWEHACGIEPAYVPESARFPLYSTWYSYHQNLKEKELENECRLAAELGFKGILVDDGWQTQDNQRGYAFCGDWKTSKEKFPNMKEHVEYVHALGMKYMLWVSVPFIGKNSQIWKRFSEKLLEYQENMEAGVADIRYKDVRDYLIEEYETLVKMYDLDGLKMDFIDEFYEDENTSPYKEGMDMLDVQDALEKMMIELYEKLKRFKPDIMIEFRQKYIGPYIRRFGNMLRVDDCPMSPLANRVGIADLRLLSGNTAVHSDMIMWNANETPEKIAVALFHCFFGCLQLSVRLEECSKEVLRVIRRYMKLAEKYSKTRLEGKFIAESPENLYPVLYGEKDDEVVIGIYEENKIITIKEMWHRILLLNASHGKVLFLNIDVPCNMNILVQDCQGNILQDSIETMEEMLKIEVPIGGTVYMELDEDWEKIFN